MGNCQSELDSPPCQWNASEPLKADPDIVGKGVIAAFLITAVAAFSAVAFAYLTDSVDDWLLNDVDLLVIGRYQLSSVSRLVSKLRNAWHEVKNFVWKCLRLKISTAGYSPLSRDNRLEAFNRFILSLSDQILATGLATLVAGVFNSCQLSLFEFNIVVSLGWFSIVTHLATLSLLREYFLQNTIVRNLRFLGMMASMVLLIFGLIVTTELYASGPDQGICLALAYEYAAPTSINYGLVSTIVTVVYLTTAFIGAVLSSSQANQVPGGYPSRYHVALIVPFMQITRRRYGSNYKDRVKIAREAANQHFEKSKKDMLAKRDMLPRLSLPRRYLVILSFYSDSFLSSIGSRFFDLSYGISQLVEARWASPPDLDESDNRMDFGQIVPLTLLAIPMLVATEIFYEYHKEKKAVKSSTRSVCSSGQLRISSAPSSVLSSGPESHLSGPYRLADPVHPPHSDPRRLQVDTFYGVQDMNISENVLLSTKASGRSDRGTQTDAQEDETRPNPEDNPYKAYFAELVLLFTIHAGAAIAAGITLNLTSWGVFFGLILAALVSLPIVFHFYYDLYQITKHLEPAAANLLNPRSSHSMNSGTSSLLGGSPSSGGGIERAPADMIELDERPRQRREDSHTMHGALPRVVGEDARTNSAGISSSSTQIGLENVEPAGTEGCEPHDGTSLSSTFATTSGRANVGMDGHSPDHRDGSLVLVEQSNPGRESPDLYGATPPQVETPQPIIAAGTSAEVDPLQTLAGAASECNDRENDGRLHNPKHQDTEGDIAIPELMHDRALTTSLERSGPVPKRTWTK